ncbi:DNA polymerase theta [Cryptosporidium bovis]|uniref:DNA polymerase theta n=1 Tax=Cryptosporidium bovis TaxID=310047 RepID=UPI00351A6924|nr:DNA polymerase theta [Cryptosporidium bovis]
MYIIGNKNKLNSKESGSKYYTYLNSLLIIKPKRRVGIWRKVYIGKGIIKKCFISIAGDPVMEPECFSVSKRELAILKEFNISQRGLNSSINNALVLEPYVSFKGTNKFSLSYWCIPNSVQHKYKTNYGMSCLSNWQVESLCSTLNFLVNENELKMKELNPINKKINIKYNSSLFIGNYQEYIITCEIIYLYRLIFSGSNVMIIFSNKQKCMSYYERCKKLFCENSLNLKIEILIQNNKGTVNWFPNIDITICTYENANILINKLIYENMYFNTIGTILIDDIIVDKNSYKAYMLDGIITKINIMRMVNPSIICLYTLNTQINGSYNVNLINNVLRLDYISIGSDNKTHHKMDSCIYIKKNNLLYSWDSLECNKPVITELSENKYNLFKLGGENLNNNQKLISDLKYFFDLIIETISLGKRVLVFCPTIDWCKKSLNTLVQIINDIVSSDDSDAINLRKKMLCYYNNVEKRNKRIEVANKLVNCNMSYKDDNDDYKQLIELIKNYGVCYYNYKLSFKEKRIIEESFSSGNILVFFSTSLKKINNDVVTDRVIIRSIGIGKINQSMKNTTGNREWLTKEDLHQICSYINNSNNKKDIVYDDSYKIGTFLFLSSEIEYKYISNLLNNNESDIIVHKEKKEIENLSLSRFILEIIQTDIADSYIGLEKLFSEFKFLKYSISNDTKNILLSLSYLLMTHLISLTPKYEEYDINELILPKKYLKSNEIFNCFNSPIILSKFALMGKLSKKNKLLGSISNIINRQVTHLMKIETGIKCLEIFMDSELANINKDTVRLVPTSLGNSLIYSQINLTLALEIYSELIKINFTGIDLSNNMQIYYLSLLAFNLNEFPKINWNSYVKLFSELNNSELEIADLYGISIEVIKQISNMVNNCPNNITGIGQLSPFILHSSYFFSGDLSYKCLIEKYRLLSIYRFYYTCLTRDICNHNLTVDYITQKYCTDLSTLKKYVCSFNLSATSTSNFCKQIGWLEFSDIFSNIVNHIESCISLRNVKYIQRMSINQSFFTHESHQDLDQYNFSKITLFINEVKELSPDITPNIAISLYFSGLNTIEKISNSNVELVAASLNNSRKLDDVLLLPNYPYNSNHFLGNLKQTEIYCLAQNIINNTKDVVSRFQSSQPNDDSNSDLDLEKELDNDIIFGYNTSGDINDNSGNCEQNSCVQDLEEIELELELELEKTQNNYSNISY